MQKRPSFAHSKNIFKKLKLWNWRCCFFLNSFPNIQQQYRCQWICINRIAYCTELFLGVLLRYNRDYWLLTTEKHAVTVQYCTFDKLWPFYTTKYGGKKKKLVDHHSFKFLAEQFREIHLHAAKNPKNVFAEGLLSQLKTILHIGRSVYKPEAFKRAPHTSFTEHELSVLFFNSLPRERFFSVLFSQFTRLMQMFSVDALLKTHAHNQNEPYIFCKKMA